MLVLYALGWVYSLADFWLNFSSLSMESWALKHLTLLMAVLAFGLAAAVGYQKEMGFVRWVSVPLSGLFLALLAILTLVMGQRMPGGEALLSGVGMSVWGYALTGMVTAVLGMWGGMGLRGSHHKRLLRRGL